MPGLKILSRWETTLHEVAVSPRAVYQAVLERLSRMNLLEVQCSVVERPQGGWGSPRRLYLRIRRKQLFFDLCVFPLGRDLQVSWWLCQQPPGLLELWAEIPGLGTLLRRWVAPNTWYEIDCITHFQHTIPLLVQAVLEDLMAPGELFATIHPQGPCLQEYEQE